MELGQGIVRLGTRERFCTQRLVRYRDRLPRDMVTAPSLAEFKMHLDKILRYFGWSSVEPGLDDPCGSLANQDIL